MHKFVGEIADLLVSDHKFAASDVKASPFLDWLMSLFKDTLLPMLLQCLPANANHGDIAAALKKLSVIQQWTLRREIRKAVWDDSMDVLARSLHAATLKRFKTITAADVQAALEDAA